MLIVTHFISVGVFRLLHRDILSYTEKERETERVYFNGGRENHNIVNFSNNNSCISLVCFIVVIIVIFSWRCCCWICEEDRFFPQDRHLFQVLLPVLSFTLSPLEFILCNSKILPIYLISLHVCVFHFYYILLLLLQYNSFWFHFNALEEPGFISTKIKRYRLKT